MGRALVVVGLLIAVASADFLLLHAAILPAETGPRTAGAPGVAPARTSATSPAPADLPSLLGRTGSAWAAELTGEESVREAALARLVGAGPEAIPLLDALIRHGDPRLRFAAAEALALLAETGGDLRVLALLARHAVDAEERERAIVALGAMEVERRRLVLDDLIASTRDDSEMVRTAAVLALEGLWSPTVLETLRKAFREDESILVRSAAADAILGAIRRSGPEDAVETVTADRAVLLLEILQGSENPRRRSEAAELLGTLGPEAEGAIPALLEAARGGVGSPIQRTALHALAGVGPAGVRVLAALVENDEDAALRHGALDALAGAGTAAGEVLPLLVREAERIGGEIEQAYARMRESGAAASPELYRNLSRERDLHLRLLLTVGEVGGERAVSALLDVGQQDARTGPTALWVLGNLGAGARSAVPRLGEILGSGGDARSYAAAATLARIGGDEAVGILLGALDDASTRVAALSGFQMLEGGIPAKGIPRVVELLRDPEANVRGVAVEILGLAGPTAREHVSRIRELLADPEWFVRFQAEQALRALEGESR